MMLAGVTLLGLGLLLSLGIAVFVNTAPQFGQPPVKEDLERIKRSPNYGKDKFVNLTATTTGNVWEALKKLPEMLSPGEGVPGEPLPVDFSEHGGRPESSSVHVTWYGHSAFLLEMHGKRVLLDPMLGEVAAPISWGSTRFAYERPIPLEDLTNIDVVVYSHDHYDHLDYDSVKLLKDRVALFITPLGVGSHLRAWGVPAEKIRELDWWDHYKVDDLEFTACPARHFSGRGVTDRDATQWASWVIKSPLKNLYFSGDSGYGDHFKEIGQRHGPFDLAMIECGQYNQAWSQIHMIPEESVQAGLDLRAKKAMPIHWGAFRLAPHHWTDPVTRFISAAENQALEYITPMIGKRWQIDLDDPGSQWWGDLE